MKGTTEQKAELLFRIHDLNGDGKINHSEFFQSVKKSMKTALEIKKKQLKNVYNVTHNPDLHPDLVLTEPSEEEILSVVNRAFAFADKNHDGVISKDEFVQWVLKTPDLRQQIEILFGANQ